MYLQVVWLSGRLKEERISESNVKIRRQWTMIDDNFGKIKSKLDTYIKYELVNYKELIT